MRAFSGFLIGIAILWIGVQLAISAWTDRRVAHEFQGIPFTSVLATDQAHLGAYGCTYSVVDLPETARSEPPRLSDLSSIHEWAAKSQTRWQPTPLRGSNEIEVLVGCLIGDARGTDRNGFFTGFGLGGYGKAAWDALNRPGNWVLVEKPSAEQQKMLFYAPQDRMALYVRWGD